MRYKTIIYDANGNEKKVLENIELSQIEKTDIFQYKTTRESVFYKLNLGETIVVKKIE